MKQEDKELLFKDISARLPYRTMVKCITDYHHEFDGELSDIHIMNFYQFDIKPYLRPMSSMTKEELKEFNSLLPVHISGDISKDSRFKISSGYDEVDEDINLFASCIDWLNAHHFDYHNLIEKGLALESPEGMYDIKENNYDTRR